MEVLILFLGKMIKLFVNTGGGTGHYISLQDHLNEHHNEVHPAWNEYMDWVNDGMNINNEKEYQTYIKKLNLKWWDTEMVRKQYEDLKSSEFSQLFDDDILKFIAHLYGIGYFNRIGIPDLSLNDWINMKGAFKQNRQRIPSNEKYSLMDLIPLRNGLNAIKRELLLALKW